MAAASEWRDTGYDEHGEGTRPADSTGMELAQKEYEAIISERLETAKRAAEILMEMLGVLRTAHQAGNDSEIPMSGEDMAQLAVKAYAAAEAEGRQARPQP